MCFIIFCAFFLPVILPFSLLPTLFSPPLHPFFPPCFLSSLPSFFPSISPYSSLLPSLLPPSSSLRPPSLLPFLPPFFFLPSFPSSLPPFFHSSFSPIVVPFFPPSFLLLPPSFLLLPSLAPFFPSYFPPSFPPSLLPFLPLPSPFLLPSLLSFLSPSSLLSFLPHFPLPSSLLSSLSSTLPPSPFLPPTLLSSLPPSYLTLFLPLSLCYFIFRNVFEFFQRQFFICSLYEVVVFQLIERSLLLALNRLSACELGFSSLELYFTHSSSRWCHFYYSGTVARSFSPFLESKRNSVFRPIFYPKFETQTCERKLIEITAFETDLHYDEYRNLF